MTPSLQKTVKTMLSRRMPRLVAFDLDGTLADTLRDLSSSVNHALRENGLPAYPDDDYRYFVGNGVDKLIERVLGDRFSDDLFDRVKNGFQDYYGAHYADFTAAYVGIDDVLRALSSSGVMTAVVSNKPDVFVPEILRALYPRHRFSVAWGKKPEFPRKPSPASLIAAMNLCGVTAAETVYVGDSDVDVRFAHAAGVRVIGASWGFRGREELEAAGADAIADAPSEILNVIEHDEKFA